MPSIYSTWHSLYFHYMLISHHFAISDLCCRFTIWNRNSLSNYYMLGDVGQYSLNELAYRYLKTKNYVKIFTRVESQPSMFGRPRAPRTSMRRYPWRNVCWDRWVGDESVMDLTIEPVLLIVFFKKFMAGDFVTESVVN